MFIHFGQSGVECMASLSEKGLKWKFATQLVVSNHN